MWKGPALAVGIGSTPYRVPDGPGPTFYEQAQEYTYTFTEQKGARFIGTLTAGKGTETVLGSFQPPYFTGGIFIDDDGALHLHDARRDDDGPSAMTTSIRSPRWWPASR